MNESTLSQLRILVERAVRPVRASTSVKSRMREELLAHVTAVFQEEVARLASEQAALERTVERFGNPTDLTGQLQESVPVFDPIKRFAEWVFFQPSESTLRRAVRYAIITEGVTLSFLFVFLLIVWRKVGELPPDALWQTSPFLLVYGYLGFTICIFESSMRRLMCDQKRSSWFQFAFVVVGSALVSMTLGILACGVSPRSILWLSLFTVGFPLVPAWILAIAFTARKRYHEEWASLQIE